MIIENYAKRNIYITKVKERSTKVKESDSKVKERITKVMETDIKVKERKTKVQI